MNLSGYIFFIAILSRVEPIPVEQVVLPNGIRDIGELESCHYVVQFADCTSAQGAPRPCVAANPYAERRATRSKRVAVSSDFARVGTISVRNAPAAVRPDLKVVNFFMQWGAGAPSTSASIQPGPRSDTGLDRFRWFQQCLEALADLVKTRGPSRVAIPWGHLQMGSDLWEACREELREFCLRVPGARVTIVQSTAEHIEHMQAKTAAADVRSAHTLAREAASLIDSPQQRALALALNDNLAAAAGAAIRGSSVISSPDDLAKVCQTHASIYPTGVQDDLSSKNEEIASDVFASAIQALVMAAAQPLPELISLPGLGHIEDEMLAGRYRCPPRPLLQELHRSGCRLTAAQGDTPDLSSAVPCAWEWVEEIEITDQGVTRSGRAAPEGSLKGATFEPPPAACEALKSVSERRWKYSTLSAHELSKTASRHYDDLLHYTCTN